MPRAAGPEPIFQRPVFMGSGLAAARRPGMTVKSRRRPHRLHERDFLRRRDAAEDRVAVGEAAEARYDVDIRLAVPPEATALGVGVASFRQVPGKRLGA